MIKKIITIIAFCLGSFNFLFATTIIDNPTSDSIEVNVSNKMVNRIVFPSKILDTSYSQEVGLVIQVYGNEAFIRYQPKIKEKVKKVGNNVEVVGEPEYIYDTAKPTEIFFITETKTYSVALHPKSIDSETIIINDFRTEKQEILKYETEDNYITTLSKITESVLKGGTPQGYKVKERPKKLKDLKDISVSYVNLYEGVLYSAHLLEVKNKTKEALILNPKEFIAYAKDSPKSISIYYDNEVNHLLPLGYAKVVIITKTKKETKDKKWKKN